MRSKVLLVVMLGMLTMPAGALAQTRIALPKTFKADSFSFSQAQAKPKPDSRKNGFLIGLAVGAVGGAVVGWGYINNLCINETGACPGTAAAAAATFALAGGWIGWEIDDRVGRQIVFARVRF